ncbi:MULTISPECIES: beta-glucoside-specific PTS transporter subunit IIABC [Paenibacillus]|uniref:PTS system beta-glucoside-specific IIA component (Glc family) /PTS system beta-glucoside-specific IIB component (Glc family) /PTS system beta-glucoside-specific IIC component (Glc family) n=1 Tax=Paenibacillus pabuli TaxID=1472 RepID=A0A855Y079_9BACL|nr:MULTISPECIES: beta-glucoside-specific PTS transporter subunit IIABC [Paenibacillus]PWW43346.1 PTS system beta-glucoside-specific IIA component (Glc family) /PTS system beta-glucoside-specific IIB component (Glc family) /PTS system beta-glucoside-specific IIC component (Glc family) [Paenibacillus pabuli]PXW09253.1 PTS system beta-glucoside-specific IIA component (Glc family) /PTS system beta-glucoside-specific IIB component (Glc family) /PTS system beta-glucoside-specific IIC component (Glc fam
MDKQQLSKDILKLVGGEENIDQVTHCMTRLRFNLNDNKKADKATLKNTPGVMGVMENGGQFQVIIGNDVPVVYNALVGNMSKSPDAKPAASSGTSKKKNPLSAVFDFISGVFTPILPAITGAGMLKGIVALLLTFGWIDATSSTYIILSAIGDGAFYFLPIILGISTARKLGSNMYIGAAIGASVMHPTITALLAPGENVTFIGLPVVAATYASSVIPILIAIWLASYVEKAIDKVTHASLKLIVVPTVTLLIIVPVMMIAVGPLGVIIGNGLTDGINWLFNNAGLFAGLLVGGAFSLLIITGMHYALVPIMIGSIATLGYDYLIPLMMMANFAQAGSALGVSLKSKNKQIKSLSASTGVTALMGITEPAMYGVNMRFKKPFVAALIGAAISGAFVSFFQTKAYVIGGLAGLSGIPMIIGPTFVYALIGIVIAVVVSAILTYILGFEDVPEAVPAAEATPAAEPTTPAATTSASAVTAVEETKVLDQDVFSPITGEVKPLSEVPDPAFSEEIMGKGFAIQPSEGRVVSPINGTVFSLSKSGHAIGLVSDNGAEMLIHIGIDTVKLKGQFFSPKVQAGAKVAVGDVLMEFDREEIEKAGYTTITPVIITNMHQYHSIESAGRTTIKEKELLFTAKA